MSGIRWGNFDVQASCSEGEFAGLGYVTLRDAKEAALVHMANCDFCRMSAEGVVIMLTGYARPSAVEESAGPAHQHGHRPQDCDHYDASHGSVCDLCCSSCNGGGPNQ